MDLGCVQNIIFYENYHSTVCIEKKRLHVQRVVTFLILTCATEHNLPLPTLS